MPRGNPQGYLKTQPYKPATQGFEGQAAGGRGTFGVNLGEGAADRDLAYDPKGTFGSSVDGGQASGTFKRMQAESTGMHVENPTPASAFPKPTTGGGA